MTERFLCHFTFFAYTPAYWAASSEVRKQVSTKIIDRLQGAVPRFDLYQIFPAQSSTDFLLWCNQPVDQPEDSLRFFDCLGRTINAHREWIQPTLTLWGYTRPSSYARGKSEQAIDPMAAERKKYLVVYPFVKTVDWYRTGRDTRQGMMNEHIRIGHQYGDITQLLLYSTGLQDQEFVVVYETDDLPQFSDLVVELRGSEARRYTERDTPVFTGFYHKPEETLGLSA